MTAEKYIEQGKEHLNVCLGAIKTGHVSFVRAGFAFIDARRVCGAGNFTSLIEENESNLSTRSVYRAIECAERTLALAARKNPQLESEADLRKAALSLPLSSPKELTATLRQYGMLKQVGAYDAAAHQRRKEAQRLASSAALEAAMAEAPFEWMEWVGQLPAGVQGSGPYRHLGLVDAKILLVTIERVGLGLTEAIAEKEATVVEVWPALGLQLPAAADQDEGDELAGVVRPGAGSGDPACRQADEDMEALL